MKKLILLFAIAGFNTQAQTQKVKPENVPPAVTTAFKKAHPSIKDVEWSIDGKNYVAEYDVNRIEAKDVPVAVTTAFSDAHPSIKNVEWSKDGKNYEAVFEEDNVDASITYDASGKIMETETAIAVCTLPASVMEYVKKNYKENDVKETSKITDAKGIVTYELGMKRKDLIFDSNGNFIKSLKN